MLIDTHCHLTSPELRSAVATVLARAAAAGVARVLTVATDPTDLAAALELAAAHPTVGVIAGIHPHEAGRCGAADLDALAAALEADAAGARRIVAVGETGLDYHYDFAPRPRQEEVFRAQLRLASERGLPVVIHARESEDRVCEILAEYPQLAGRVVFHCFSADERVAARALALGCSFSFTGVVTFRKADTIRAAARSLPPERILLETDAPWLSPEPHRKVRPNEPALLVHTARSLAQVRGESFETLAATTTANARRFFGLAEE